MRTVVAHIACDGGDRIARDCQSIRGLGEPHALHGFGNAFARYGAVDAVEVVRREMRDRGEAIHRVGRAWVCEYRLDDTGDPSVVIAFGVGLHDGRSIVRSPPEGGADLAEF